MDRSVLEGDPHVVLEGMAIAGYAIIPRRLYLCTCRIPDRGKRLQIAIDPGA